jgi:hypothetical protein
MADTSVFYTSWTGTATTSEKSVSLDVIGIDYIINDSTSTLTIGLDVGTTGTDVFTVKTGEVLKGIDFPVDTMYYKGASTGDSFRFCGKYKKD